MEMGYPQPEIVKFQVNKRNIQEKIKDHLFMCRGRIKDVPDCIRIVTAQVRTGDGCMREDLTTLSQRWWVFFFFFYKSICKYRLRFLSRVDTVTSFSGVPHSDRTCSRIMLCSPQG